jgi:hypothetical protein
MSKAEWKRAGATYSTQYGSFALTVSKEETLFGTRWIGRVDGIRYTSASSSATARRSLIQMIELRPGKP